MSDWIEVGGKPIKEESTISLLRATVKNSATHANHNAALMFFKDGASKQKRDLHILELLVLNNTSVTGTVITLPNVAPFKSLPAWFEAGYHPDKSQSTPTPPPCCSWSLGCVWTVHPATGPHSCLPAIPGLSLHAACDILPVSSSQT